MSYQAMKRHVGNIHTHCYVKYANQKGYILYESMKQSMYIIMETVVDPWFPEIWKRE